MYVPYFEVAPVPRVCCTRCGRILAKRAAWLHMQVSRPGRYVTDAHAAHEGWLNTSDDQGAFPFGPECARAGEVQT